MMCRTIVRNCRIFQDPHGTSIEEYQKRFKCLIIMDVLYALIYGSQGFLEKTSAGKEFLTIGVALLFALDAVLAIWLQMSISKWPTEVSSSALEKIVFLNIASNIITICVYGFSRVESLAGLSPGNAIGVADIYLLALPLVAVIGKATKVLVLWAFRTWVQGQAASMGGQQMPGTMPATVPLQGVVVARAPPGTQAGGFQQSQA